MLSDNVVWLTAAAATLAMVAWNKEFLQKKFWFWAETQLRKGKWACMPHRIIMLRHGEGEHNVDKELLATKADSRIELTEKGREQAKEAGRRIKALLDRLGPAVRLSVILSPYERTQQTWLNVLHEIGEDRVDCVYMELRVREQEFGNLQDPESHKLHSQKSSIVGRFWYRRPQAESCADVYDRVAGLWDDIMANGSNVQLRSRLQPPKDDGNTVLLIVTHGLTMRLLAGRYFAWSPDTMNTVYNPSNCDMWVLGKRERGPELQSYRFLPEESHPPRLPWATRAVKVIRSTGEQEDYTVVDYLSLPQPRASLVNLDAALRRMIKGHPRNLDPTRGCDPETILKSVAVPPNPETIIGVDWWNSQVSQEGFSMRTNLVMSGFGTSRLGAYN